MIPFGEWLPDQPDQENPGATQAKNVYPAGRTYRPMKSLTDYSDAMAEYGRGAISARDSSGNVYAYCGTETKLYALGAAVADASRTVGGAYATASEDGWEFAKWGEKIIGTNFGDTPQIITMGATNFADLSGSPPQARHLGVVRDFVVFGNTYDAVDGNVPNRVRWSAYQDETGWTAGTSQSDYQDLLGDGGWVQKVVGGEYGVIFQEKATWRMTYVGPPLVFQFDEIAPGRGTLSPGSVVRYGRNIFYAAHDGFYALVDGSEPVPISAEKVTRFFMADMDDANIHRMSAAVDPHNTIVVWAYPASGNVGGRPNRLLIYNWVAKRWSYAELDVDLIFTPGTFGYTLDGLDAIGTLESLSFSLDSRVWTGGSIQLGAITDAHKLAYFDGAALDAVIETAELGGSSINMIKSVRPYVQGGGASTITVQIGTRASPTSDVTWGAETTLDATGKSNHRATGRYVRGRINITGGFEHAMGIDVDMIAVGKR